MKRDIQGRYQSISTAGERAQAFIPSPLPPTPPVNWTNELRQKFEEAHLALGRLDSMSNLIPDTSLFLYMYVRKEAVLSSMIEGTQSSLSDLLLYELDEVPGVPLDDAEEVSSYVAALNYGFDRLGNGFPLSNRLIKDIHGVLLATGRGRDKAPGEFRRTQNWIGGSKPSNAVFVPPPPEQVVDCMNSLELFLHDQPEPTPPLLKAALAHVQFETIHPFLDGNGRLGRLLITLLLCDSKILTKPMLYLSLYFKTHRQSYYDLLNSVRLRGDWEAWLSFFAEAITMTATQASETTQKVVNLTQKHQDQISTMGRRAPSALMVYRQFLKSALATPMWLAAQSGLTPATVNKSLLYLVERGILKEITSQKRNRVFVYPEYIAMLDEGTQAF